VVNEIVRVPGKLGRKHQRDNSPGRERYAIAWLHEYQSLPTPAYPIDVSQSIADWMMLGNDQYGDCVPAAVAHDRMLAGAHPSTKEIVDLYLTYDNGQDEGVVIADFLLWLFQHGHIEGFAPVALDKCDAVMAWLARGVLLGVQLTDADQGDFRNGVPWGTSSTTPNPDEGHGILLVKSESNSTPRTCVTWGAEQGMTPQWFANCVKEAWAIVTRDDMNTDAYAALIADLRLLPHAHLVPPPPTPVPVTPPVQPPAPSPTPPPAPTPGPTPADVHGLLRAFAADVRAAVHALEHALDRLFGK